ncbi:porin family protein [soil metagenome]
MLQKMVAMLAAGCACGAASPAMAADFPVKAALPAYDWSGFYLGGYLGYGRQTGLAHFGPGNAFSQNYFVQGWIPESLSTNADGVLGGLQIGVNSQSGVLVYGVETDISFAALKSDGVSTFVGAGANFVSGAGTKLDTLGTLRGRIGYTPWEHSLLYFTGGLAYGHAEMSSSVSVTNSIGQVFCGPVGICASATTAKWQAGWTVGGGWEQAVAQHWSVKLEYLYYDLGSISHTITDVPSVAFADSHDFKGHIARAGVNYRF